MRVTLDYLCRHAPEWAWSRDETMREHGIESWAGKKKGREVYVTHGGINNRGDVFYTVSKLWGHHPDVELGQWLIDGGANVLDVRGEWT